jgi:hypothetical protein
MFHLASGIWHLASGIWFGCSHRLSIGIEKVAVLDLSVKDQRGNLCMISLSWKR